MRMLLNRWLLAAFLLSLFAFPLSAQVESESEEEEEEMTEDSTGLAGDNFSLEAALELFKQSESPEDFEKRLNTEGNPANNLDLNEDGQTDYVRVEDRTEGDVHAFVLQVAVSQSESQDVAVIELEKTGKEEAILQIVGDADVFGEETIVEPFEEDDDEGGRGPAMQRGPVRVVINVWLWPSVRFVYAPAYRPWVSPWRWGLHPTWWRPWRVRPWGVFRVGFRPFRPHYHVAGTHRVVRAHAVYVPHRRHSTVVRTKTTTVVTHHGKHGTVKTKRKTTTTTVRGKHGTHTKKTKTVTHKRRGRH